MINLIFNRRNFIKLGAIGYCSTFLKLSDILGSEHNKNKSVIWVWLGGGPTHFELFNARLDVPNDLYRPVEINGALSLYDSLTEIKLGGGFSNLIKHSKKLNVVANFSHDDASHNHATHWLNTGHFNTDRSVTATAKYPSHGSIVSSVHGVMSNNGIPIYVTQEKIDGDTSAWLGSRYNGFHSGSKSDLYPNLDISRINNRKDLLNKLDSIHYGAANYNDQAFDVILGEAKKAFNIDEWPIYKEEYGNSYIGKELWLAERLVSYGSKFVTIHYGGWDMHSSIQNGLKHLLPPLDIGLSALINRLEQKDKLNDVMIVVTGEFGRTRLNSEAGRDHWPQLTPLLIVGGNYESGRVIGRSNKDNYLPEDKPYYPIDLQATLFNHLNIPKDLQKIDNSGRPRYLLEGDHKLILDQ